MIIQIITLFGEYKKGINKKANRHFRSDPCLLIGRSPGKLIAQLPSPSVDFSFPHSGMASASPFLSPESESAPTNFPSPCLTIESYLHVNMQVGCVTISSFLATMHT